MKLCFCRFLMAAAVIVLAVVWWPAAWAKWVIVALAAVLAIMSLFYQTCCCRSMKKTEAGAEKAYARNRTAGKQETPEDLGDALRPTSSFKNDPPRI